VIGHEAPVAVLPSFKVLVVLFLISVGPFQVEGPGYASISTLKQIHLRVGSLA
jgi:hypothetical protein